MRLPNFLKASSDLKIFIEKIKYQVPFVFVRFSDGETEILLGNKLSIMPGKTFFRGKHQPNNFPVYDSKNFDPNIHSKIREHLILSAFYKSNNYFKGVPGLHNRMFKERRLLFAMNSFTDHNLTFSDLFVNSNFEKFEQELVPLLLKSKPYLVANYRAVPTFECIHVPIPDDFFGDFDRVFNDIFLRLKSIPANSLVISAASSLSNILGFQLNKVRPDLTFIDIGTSLNKHLSLNTKSRLYYDYYDQSFARRLASRLKPGFRLIW